VKDLVSLFMFFCAHTFFLNQTKQIALIVLQEGAYALIFKSTHFPNQIVATRKGSPLLIGIKTEGQMEDHIAVDYDTKKGGTFSARLGTQSPACFLPPSTLIKPLLLLFLPPRREVLIWHQGCGVFCGLRCKCHRGAHKEGSVPRGW